MLNRGILFVSLMILTLVSGTVASAVIYPNDSFLAPAAKATDIETNHSVHGINESGCIVISQPQCIEEHSCLINCSTCGQNCAAASSGYLTLSNTPSSPSESINSLYDFVTSNAKTRPPKPFF